MFPIGSQLQANDVIVIISGAIARNVGHQVMKLLRIYSPPHGECIACVYVVHFLPGKINILRVSVGRRCSLLKRDYLPTLDRAPRQTQQKTRATTQVRPSCDERDFQPSFLSSLLEFDSVIYTEIFVCFYLPPPRFVCLFHVFTVYSFLFFFFFERGGED